MRFAAALVFWLATTLAVAVAVPVAWVQQNIVNEDGCAAMAREAAVDPALQSAVAAELTTWAMALIADQGVQRYPVDSSTVHDAAVAFTAGRSFPPLFAQASRAAHRWLFTDPRGQDGDQWVVDIAPMLKESSFREILSRYNVEAPAKLTVPLSVSAPQPLRRGELSRIAVWGPWLAIGVIVLSGGCGMLTLVAARGRGRALSSLGVSTLLVGAAGWAGVEVGGRYIDDALNRTTGDIRRIAEVLVTHAVDRVHLWFSLTLAAGAALVVCGALVAMLGGLRNSG